jgi:hypothetical protein
MRFITFLEKKIKTRRQAQWGVSFFSFMLRVAAPALMVLVAASEGVIS